MEGYGDVSLEEFLSHKGQRLIISAPYVNVLLRIRLRDETLRVRMCAGKFCFRRRFLDRGLIPYLIRLHYSIGCCRSLLLYR